MSRAFSYNENSTVIANSFNYTVPDDESRILAWLSPLEPRIRHRDIGTQRIDSIGCWVLETEEFRRWHDASGEGGSTRDHATLFCDGNPGAGKSYITSLVIDKLCDEAAVENIAVICFYFDFAARNEQSPVNMLGSLLRQLVSGLEEIPEVVVQSFRDQKKVIGGRGLQIPGVLKMFQTITATKRTFICVDALDECVPEHRTVVLESLRQVLRGSPNTRIFVTGRPHVRGEVVRKLDGTAGFVFIQPTEDDVIRFLREKLQKDATPNLMSSTLLESIMKNILEISSETFLLPSLHIEAILRETTVSRRKQRLQSTKDSARLGDAYGATLERIMTQGEEKAKLAVAALTWVCYSERPLEVDELCHALAVEIGATDFDPENTPLMSTLLDCCQSLITVDEEESTVRLIHFTVQEYLCAHPDLFSKPHSMLAEICLTYLNSQQIKNLPSYPLPDHQSAPFLAYSSRYWGTHANRELSNRARALALELLNQYEDHVSALLLLKQELHQALIGAIDTSPLFSGLHCASFFGIVELATALINSGGCEANQQDCLGSTPLSWAARNGHEGIVKLLLHWGDTDPNLPGVDDLTPLGWAAVMGHGGVAKILLERENVDSNRSDKHGLTPLLWAAAQGHEGVVKLLLEREDVDPNPPPKNNNMTPLCHAAAHGYEGVVKLLLEREDVDPNFPDENDIAPLGYAAAEGHEGVVKLLLKQENVDPNLPDNGDRTPLGWAAMRGHEGVVRLLLERENIDPGRADKNGFTPLGWAAGEGHEGVVKLLLERENVDPNLPDNNGATPLLWAATMGYAGVAQLLLERRDIDPNRPDKQGLTPLGCAAAGGYEGVVKLLLQQENVDLNPREGAGLTPLACAACQGYEGVVKLLLERENVDPNLPDKNDVRPLGYAAALGREGVVKLLLKRQNVDPNLPDKNGRTPFARAAALGHEGVVKLLLEWKNVDPDRPDKDGLTPLGRAAAEGHEGVVKLLLERGNVGPNRPPKND